MRQYLYFCTSKASKLRTDGYQHQAHWKVLLRTLLFSLQQLKHIHTPNTRTHTPNTRRHAHTQRHTRAHTQARAHNARQGVNKPHTNILLRAHARVCMCECRNSVRHAYVCMCECRNSIGQHTSRMHVHMCACRNSTEKQRNQSTRIRLHSTLLRLY